MAATSVAIVAGTQKQLLPSDHTIASFIATRTVVTTRQTGRRLVRNHHHHLTSSVTVTAVTRGVVVVAVVNGFVAAIIAMRSFHFHQSLSLAQVLRT
jgi:hypothetical protein